MAVTASYCWLANSVLALSKPDNISFWSGLPDVLRGSGCFWPNSKEVLTERSLALLAVPHGGEIKTMQYVLTPISTVATKYAGPAPRSSPAPWFQFHNLCFLSCLLLSLRCPLPLQFSYAVHSLHRFQPQANPAVPNLKSGVTHVAALLFAAPLENLQKHVAPDLSALESIIESHELLKY